MRTGTGTGTAYTEVTTPTMENGYMAMYKFKIEKVEKKSKKIIVQQTASAM
jgi:hypothetical protein